LVHAALVEVCVKKQPSEAGIAADVILNLYESPPERPTILTLQRFVHAVVPPAEDVKQVRVLASRRRSIALFWANRQLIMDHATAMRLPVIYEFPEIAELG
jgi:hypothetical protein